MVINISGATFLLMLYLWFIFMVEKKEFRKLPQVRKFFGARSFPQEKNP